MGYLIDERRFIDSNIFLHESRIQSQLARFLDRTPTYVTYYHINNIESMTDMGFVNVERRLGNNSPIKYNEIKNFPLYGVDPIEPELNIQDEGLNSEYSSNAVIVPNTITPYPDDLFIIETTSHRFVFRVTSVRFDSIRSNGYYSIDFSLEYTDDESLKLLEKQVSDRYTCAIENIGTEENVILHDDDIEIIDRMEQVSSRISEFYRILFYDKRYNSFLYTNEIDGVRLYDSLLTNFISRNKIFQGSKGYDTLYLTDEDPNYKNDFAYHESIYRAFEERRPEIIKDMHYMPGYVNNTLSVFHHWRDESVLTTTLGIGCKEYVRPEILELFRNAKSFFNVTNDGDDIGGDKCCTALDISIPVGNDEYAKPVIVPSERTEDPFDVEADRELGQPDDADYENAIELSPDHVLSTKEQIEMRIREADENSADDNDDNVDPTDDTANSVEGVASNSSIDLGHPTHQEYSDEDEQIVPFRGTKEQSVIASNGEEFKIKRISYEYDRPNSKPIGESILTHTITTYMSGIPLNIRHLNLDMLEDHIEYMRPNHETFILIPVLLFVLRQYYNAFMGN